jgi:hypothetical protein
MQQAALFRRERQFGYCCSGFRLRKSARSAGDIGVSSVQLFEYSCVNILPQITQITQRNAAELHYFAEKD